MRRIKLVFVAIIFLSLFLPFIKTDSESSKMVYNDEKNNEKLYKIELNNFNINYLNEIKDKLKIREIEPNKIDNIEYKYNVKTTDNDLSHEFMDNYYEYMNSKNKAEFLLKNNNIQIKYISVLNTYNEIDKILKKYGYKIIE